MFEKAIRSKLRFVTVHGLASVEDLWDLPLTTKSSSKTSLDDIAISLNADLKNYEDSFVTKKTKKNAHTELGFEVVKHIIKTKLAEQEAADKKIEIREKKQKIMSILSKKKDEALEGQSVEELEKMLEEV